MWEQRHDPDDESQQADVSASSSQPVCAALDTWLGLRAENPQAFFFDYRCALLPSAACSSHGLDHRQCGRAQESRRFPRPPSVKKVQGTGSKSFCMQPVSLTRRVKRCECFALVVTRNSRGRAISRLSNVSGSQEGLGGELDSSAKAAARHARSRSFAGLIADAERVADENALLQKEMESPNGFENCA